TSDSNGQWSVVLPKQQAQNKGRELRVSSMEEQIVFKDVVIGDLWLLIGQSNMAFELKGGKYFDQQKNNLHQPLLRFYNPTFAGKYIFNRHFKDSVLTRLTTELFYSDTDWEVS